MSNANSATQAPHTEEDVPMDLSDSGGMQSPQTKVNDDVEFSDSSLDQLPCAADNYTMDLCDVDVIPSTKFTNANPMELPNSDADQDVSPGVYKGIFTRNLLNWPELWNTTFRYL